MIAQAEAAARLDKLRGFLKMDPGNAHMLAEGADLALQLGMPKDAEAWTQRALADAPQDPFLLVRLASAKIALGETDPAIRLLEPLAAAHESEPAIRYNLGYAYLRAARYAEAKDALAAIVEHAAAPANTRHLLARALHHLGEVDEGIEHARKYVEAHPDDALAAGTLSLLYLDNEDFAEAKQWSERALSREPAMLDALLAAGTVAAVDERPEDAERAFDSALKISPANGRAWAGRGIAAMLRFDLAAARGYFEKALLDMPDEIATINALGWCQMLLGDLAAAKATFERSLAVNRNIGETHGGLAMVAAFERRWHDADENAKRAVALDPRTVGGRMVEVMKAQSAGKSGADAFTGIAQDMKTIAAPGGGGTIADMLVRTMARRVQPANRGPKPRR